MIFSAATSAIAVNVSANAGSSGFSGPAMTWLPHGGQGLYHPYQGVPAGIQLSLPCIHGVRYRGWHINREMGVESRVICPYMVIMGVEQGWQINRVRRGGRGSYQPDAFRSANARS